MSYIAHQDVLDPFYAAIKQRFGTAVHTHYMRDTYLPDYFFLSVGHPQANKREGVRKWAELMGCDPAVITAFGDHLNDFGLFDAVGTRVAVANAQAELKARADIRLDRSNNEDAVAHYLNEAIGGGEVCA